MRGSFAHGVLALVMGRSWCAIHLACMFSGEGELKNILKYCYDGIFGFMWEQIRVVQCFLLDVRPEACSLLWVGNAGVITFQSCVMFLLVACLCW